MDPSETAVHLPEPDRWQEPDALSEAVADLRVLLTTILGRSQLLERRIRTGRITDVEACLDTLATGTPWQRIEHRGLERGLRGSVWRVEGFNAGAGSGLYRLTIEEPSTAEETRSCAQTALRNGSTRSVECSFHISKEGSIS